MLESWKILKPGEIQAVIAALAKKRPGKNGKTNDAIFRLAACYGLRIGEMVALNLGDIVVDGPCPLIRIRKDTTKGGATYGQQRRVPLDLDSGSLEVIRTHHKQRCASTNGDVRAPLLTGTGGKRLSVDLARKRWRTAIKVLGPARVKQLSPHKGRHTFCSYAAQQYGLATTKQLAGHRAISSTDVYVHPLGVDGHRDLWDFGTSPAVLPGQKSPKSR
jgi:integrase